MKFSILDCFIRITNLHDCWYTFLIKLLCNLRTAFALHITAPQSEGKDIPYNSRLFLIHYDNIFYFLAFLVPKRNLSENIFAICALIFKRSLYLNRYILTV